MEIFLSDYSGSAVGELPFTAKEMLWAKPGDRREQVHLLNLIFPRRWLRKGTIRVHLHVKTSWFRSLCGTGAIKLQVPSQLKIPKFRSLWNNLISLLSSVQIYVPTGGLMTRREQLYFQSLKVCISLLYGSQFFALQHEKSGRKEALTLLWSKVGNMCTSAAPTVVLTRHNSL